MKDLQQLEKEIAIDEYIISSVGDGLMVTDKEGKIMMMNPAAEKMLLYKEHDVKSKDLVDIVPAADLNGKIIPKEKRPLHTVLKSGVSFTNHAANYYLRSDKTKFRAAITTSPIIFKNKIIGAVITFRDITELAEIDRMKTEFLSVASHQLRTPLSAIKWFLEILLDGDAGKFSKIQREFLQYIEDSNNRMIALINDLLNITRIESGRISVEPKPTRLDQLVDGVLREVKPKIQAKKQNIVVSYHPNLPKINIDTNLIRLVYINLLSNATKYTPEKGEITIMISKKGDKIISQVSDNGYGIQDNEKAKVFQKFFRGSNITDKVLDSTGLGLYLAKSIIESSSGKIWFKSH